MDVRPMRHNASIGGSAGIVSELEDSLAEKLWVTCATWWQGAVTSVRPQ